MSILKQLNLSSIFKKALATGGDFAELFYEKTTAHQVFFEQNKLDRIQSGIDCGVGLRIIYENQSVYGYTNDITNQGLESLAQTLSAVVNRKSNPPQKTNQTIAPSFTNIIEKDPSTQTHKQRVAIAEKANLHAWKNTPNIKQATVGYVETKREFEIANSNDEFAKDSKQYLTFYTQLVGEKNGITQTAYTSKGGYTGLELFDETPAEEVVNEASRKLGILLDAKPAPAGTMPVVISAEAGGTMVHEAVGHGLEADLACNGLSVYQNRIGQQVASPLITILDDGTMQGKRGSYGIDDEGAPSQKTVLIENGILKSYMVDLMSAKKFDLKRTGNGRRQSYRHKPIVRMTNTYIASGKDNPDDILKSTKYGLFVKSMGGGQVNTVTGDYVFAVTEGYLIRNGEPCEAVRGATLTGNGPKTMQQIDRVGSDLGFIIGTCGKDGQQAPVTDAQPTLRMPEMVVGGEVPMSNYF